VADTSFHKYVYSRDTLSIYAFDQEPHGWGNMMNMKVGSSLVRDMHAYGVTIIDYPLRWRSLFVPRVFGVTKMMQAAVTRTCLCDDVRKSVNVRKVLTCMAGAKDKYKTLSLLLMTGSEGIPQKCTKCKNTHDWARLTSVTCTYYHLMCTPKCQWFSMILLTLSFLAFPILEPQAFPKDQPSWTQLRTSSPIIPLSSGFDFDASTDTALHQIRPHCEFDYCPQGQPGAVAQAP
jgi:hypothetical protein